MFNTFTLLHVVGWCCLDSQSSQDFFVTSSLGRLQATDERFAWDESCFLLKPNYSIQYFDQLSNASEYKTELCSTEPFSIVLGDMMLVEKNLREH